jgi:hypothetical protein
MLPGADIQRLWPPRDRGFVHVQLQEQGCAIFARASLDYG